MNANRVALKISLRLWISRQYAQKAVEETRATIGADILPAKLGNAILYAYTMLYREDWLN